MKKHELIGKEFKWVSPRTSGETFGVIERVFNISTYPKIESTKKNCYYLNDCSININGQFVKIDKIEN